jgi:hypothetical protein
MACSLTLKKEAMYSFFILTIWYYIPEDNAPIETIMGALGSDEKLQVTAFTS